MTDPQCVAFLQWALPKIRLHWPGFRKVRGQVRKRIARRLEQLGLSDLDSYGSYLESHPGEWSFLDACCRISISRFYRDRGVFDCLGREILPELARNAIGRGDGLVHAWSAGCASGEEPYTLAMLAARNEFTPGADPRIKVTATDADAQLLERARVGCYPASSLKDLPPDWRAQGFQPVGGRFVVRPEFRRSVEFLEQDIRHRMPDGPFDLVLCRYLVFTYFEVSLQGELLGRILERIRPGGVFAVGKHETLPPGSWGLSPWGRHLGIYRVGQNTPSFAEGGRQTK